MKAFLNFNWLTPKKAVLFLIIIGFLVYFNSLFNGFVSDDKYQILNNKFLQSLTNIPRFFSGSTFYFEGQDNLQGTYYKPIMTTFYSIIYTIFGPRPFYFHLFQVLLHSVNAILVFTTLRYLFLKEFSQRKNIIAFLISLVFLVHPINQQAAGFIAALQETLFFFFGMLALLIIMKSNGKNLQILLSFPLLLLSILSKEAGILFVVVIGIYVGIYQKRRLFLYVIGGIFVVGIYFFLRHNIADLPITTHFDSPITRLPLGERLLNVPAIIFYYLKTFFFPKELLYQDFWILRELNLADFYFPLLFISMFSFVILVVGMHIWYRNKILFKHYVFFLLWFGVGMGLYLHIFPIDITVTDRWFYFPVVGILGMIGVASQTIQIRGVTVKKLAGLLLISMLVSLSIRTVVRNFDWKDNLTLFSHEVKIVKDPYDLDYALAVELGKRGQYDEALVHLTNLTRSPRHIWPNWYYIGLFYEKKGDIQKAKESIAKAIEESKKTILGPLDFAYEKLAILKLHSEDAQSTKVFTQEAIEKLPKNPKLWLVRALAEYKLGNHKQALGAASKSFELLPDEESFYVLSQLEHNFPIEF